MNTVAHAQLFQLGRRGVRAATGFNRREPGPAWRASDPEQLDLEHERGVRGNDATRTPSAEAQLRRNGELALAAHFHALHAFVPRENALAGAAVEREGVAAVLAGVELAAVG